MESFSVSERDMRKIEMLNRRDLPRERMIVPESVQLIALVQYCLEDIGPRSVCSKGVDYLREEMIGGWKSVEIPAPRKHLQ